MDGVVDIPDADLDAIYAQTEQHLSVEWELIKAIRDVRLRRELTVAHGRLHWYLADQAAARGIPFGPQPATPGGDKPPHPV